MAVQNFGSGGGGNQLSPGINISEIDLTTIVPAVDTTVGAFAGTFRWGPVNEPVLVTSENDLVTKFGKPTSINPETFFTAASFLAYSNALYISRAANTTAQFAAIAVANTVPNTTANAIYTVLNNDSADDTIATITGASIEYIARWPGDLGNSLKISVCESSAQYSSQINLISQSAGTINAVSYTFNGANTNFDLAVGNTVATVTLDASTAGNANSTHNANAAAQTVNSKFAVGDYIQVTAGGASQSLKIIKRGELAETALSNGVYSFTLTFDQPLKLATAVSADTVTRFWEYYSTVNGAPGRSTYVELYGNTASQIGNTAAQNDEIHVVIVDEDGGFTSSPGQILEVYQGLSRATDAKNNDGSSNYFKNVINDQSLYVWAGAARSGASSNTALNVKTSINDTPLTLSFAGGTDKDETTSANTGLPFADLAKAYDKFVSPEDIDVSLVLTGTSRGGTNGEQLANYLIDNIAEVRKDCVVFVSPQQADVVNKALTADANVVEFRNSVRSSSYAVMDSGYKYMYDKYNDIYRWVPLNGDIAGTCVRTDNTRDPWFSPAGTSRGQIKNVIKLAFNPNLSQRNLLYKNGINPVISQPGQGVILFGDKTLLAKPSAFDRINVRRLFIVLEKAISQAAKTFLFEFNDEFTRTQFRNLIEPYLRDVQGRRGIYDYRVVCDETNNTAQVIDSNKFIGDIYIKPARSINFIQLNFVAVRTGIQFAEIVGG